MKHFSRFAVMILMAFVLNLALAMYGVYVDLVGRGNNMSVFTRLAVKDALINVQTTEENGLGYLSESATHYTTSNSEALSRMMNNLSLNGRGGYYPDATETRDEYADYLTTLLDSTDSKHSDVFKKLQAFLADNAESTEGNAMFRPIQFGMTYVDTDVFVDSFCTGIQSMIDANYFHEQMGKGNNLILVPDEAVRVDAVNFEISEPQIAILAADAGDSVIFQSLYGVDTFMEAESKANLGVDSSAVNFYIYYDITVEVDWSSACALPMLQKRFWGDRIADSYFNSAGNMMIPGKPITYSYRYVLLN